jgi:hypothetical protein
MRLAISGMGTPSPASAGDASGHVGRALVKVFEGAEDGFELGLGEEPDVLVGLDFGLVDELAGIGDDHPLALGELEDQVECAHDVMDRLWGESLLA